MLLAASAILITSGLFLFWLINLAGPSSSPPQKLGDHEITLTLTRVRTGKNVEFPQGTIREKLLDFLLPAKGLKLGGHIFSPPNKSLRFGAADDGALFLEFKIDSPPGLIYADTSQGAMRLIAVNQPNPISLYGASLAPRPGTNRPPPTGVWHPAGTAPTANFNLSNMPGSLAFDGGSLSLTGRARPIFTSDPSGGVSLPVALVQYSVPARPLSGPMLVGTSNEFRMALIGEDGFEFVERFWPRLVRVLPGYIYIQPKVYPRQSRTLTMRIEERARQTAPWQTLATFQTPIKPQPVKSWTAEQTPIRKSQSEANFVVDEVSIVETTFHDGSKYETRISYHLLQENVPQDDWNLISLTGEDAGGNSGNFTTATTSTDDGLVTESPQVLNPNQVWHLQAVFRRKGVTSAYYNYSFEFFVQPINKIAKP